MVQFIEAADAEIHFNRSAAFVPSEDILVCSRSSRKLGTKEAIIGRRFSSCYGAMNSSWMKGEDRTDTPEGVFASEWLNSVERISLDAMKAALREFGKIDRCDWARLMFRAIEHDPEYGAHGEAE